MIKVCSASLDQSCGLLSAYSLGDGDSVGTVAEIKRLRLAAESLTHRTYTVVLTQRIRPVWTGDCTSTDDEMAALGSVIG